MNKKNLCFNPIKVMAFLFGLFCCENITAIFSVGNTSFTIGQIISVALFIFLLLKNRRFPSLPKALVIFLLLVLLSGMFSILYFGKAGIVRFFVGLIELGIALVSFFGAMYLFDYKDYIIKGFLAGLVVNIFLVIVAYVTFNNGQVILPTGQFIAKQFYTPLYSFRSQGAFLEPSHFIRCIALIMLPIVFYRTNKRHNIIISLMIIASTIFCLFTSQSGTVVICFFEVLAYIVMIKRSGSTKLIAVLLAVMVFLALLILPFDFDVFKQIIDGADITNVGNAYRFQSMQLMMQQIPRYPLGAGWNMTGSVIQDNNLGTVAAFSDIIEMILEVGVIGVFPYLYFVISTIIKSLKIKNSFSICLAIALVAFFVLQVGTDYPFDTLNMAIMGLAVANIQNTKKIINKRGCQND